MLEYERIDVSDGIGVDMTNKSENIKKKNVCFVIIIIF